MKKEKEKSRIITRTTRTTWSCFYFKNFTVIIFNEKEKYFMIL
jgi:hypothetical protein